ncbi:MAG: hypothetical protein AAGO57_02610 [Pseudomonadota bacterium]
MFALKSDLSHLAGLDPAALALTESGPHWVGRPADAALTTRKVWGERCSGTNFAGALLHRNIDALKTKGGQWQWKHALAKINDRDPSRLNLFIVRDPFTWAQSFYRNPWHLPVRLRNRPFADFIRQEWVGVFYDQDKYTPERPADRHPVERRRFRNIWEMRTVKLRHALMAASRLPNGVVVRYEEVSTDPEGFVALIADRFSTGRKTPFQPIEDYKGEAKRSYEAQTTQPMDPDDRAYILGQLDTTLESFLGYLPPD